MEAKSVGSIMQTHIVGVAKSTKLSSALKLMESSAVSSLPVIYGGKLIGTISKKEIERESQKADVQKIPVEKIMKDKFDFAIFSMNIDEVAKIMIKKNIARMPVVNNTQDMLCVGMISSTEILHHKTKPKH